MISLADLDVRRSFGDTLVEEGVISGEELATAQNLHGQSGDRLSKLLIDIGAISEGDMVRHLSSYLDVPLVTAEQFPNVPVDEGSF